MACYFFVMVKVSITLSPYEIMIVEGVTGDLMRRFDYTMEFLAAGASGSTFTPSPLWLFWCKALERFLVAVNGMGVLAA